MARNQIKRSDEEWDEIIRQCKSSGLSDHQWCEDHGIAISTYYRRLRLFRDIRPEQTLPAKTKQNIQELHSVVPLTLMDELPAKEQTSYHETAASIRVGDVTIDLYNGAGQEMIASLLETAVRLC